MINSVYIALEPVVSISLSQNLQNCNNHVYFYQHPHSLVALDGQISPQSQQQIVKKLEQSIQLTIQAFKSNTSLEKTTINHQRFSSIQIRTRIIMLQQNKYEVSILFVEIRLPSTKPQINRQILYYLTKKNEMKEKMTMKFIKELDKWDLQNIEAYIACLKVANHLKTSLNIVISAKRHLVSPQNLKRQFTTQSYYHCCSIKCINNPETKRFVNEKNQFSLDNDEMSTLSSLLFWMYQWKKTGRINHIYRQLVRSDLMNILKRMDLFVNQIKLKQQIANQYRLLEPGLKFLLVDMIEKNGIMSLSEDLRQYHTANDIFAFLDWRNIDQLHDMVLMFRQPQKSNTFIEHFQLIVHRMHMNIHFKLSSSFKKIIGSLTSNDVQTIFMMAKVIQYLRNDPYRPIENLKISHFILKLVIFFSPLDFFLPYVIGIFNKFHYIMGRASHNRIKDKCFEIIYNKHQPTENIVQLKDYLDNQLLQQIESCNRDHLKNKEIGVKTIKYYFEWFKCLLKSGSSQQKLTIKQYFHQIHQDHHLIKIYLILMKHCECIINKKQAQVQVSIQKGCSKLSAFYYPLLHHDKSQSKTTDLLIRIRQHLHQLESSQ